MKRTTLLILLLLSGCEQKGYETHPIRANGAGLLCSIPAQCPVEEACPSARGGIFIGRLCIEPKCMVGSIEQNIQAWWSRPSGRVYCYDSGALRVFRECLNDGKLCSPPEELRPAIQYQQTCPKGTVLLAKWWAEMPAHCVHLSECKNSEGKSAGLCD
jgi:hypothetical protein